MKTNLRHKVIPIIVLILVIACPTILASHQVNIRYIDKYGASIIPDSKTTIFTIPNKLSISGYKLTNIKYNHKAHLVLAKYRPTSSNKEILDKVKSSKFVGVTFQPTTVPIKNKTQADPNILSRNYNSGSSGRDTLRILIGNKFGKFSVLKADYPDVNVRDPSVMKHNNKYFIIYTRGLLATNDFEHWKKIPWPRNNHFYYNQDWAPEFVTSKNGDKFIVMSSIPKGSSHHQLILTSFEHQHIGNRWVFLKGNFPTDTIDPNIIHSNGKYLLACKNDKNKKLLVGASHKLTGPYSMQTIKLNEPNNLSTEGPEILIQNNNYYLYFDTYTISENRTALFHGLHYSVNNSFNQPHWSSIKRIHAPIVTRHGQFIKND